MDHLPYELLSPIFSHLSNSDIINLPYSISCNGLTHVDVAARFRQQIEAISIDEASLRSLLRASQHPLIGPTIKVLNFGLDPERLERLDDEDYQRYHKQDHLEAKRAWEKRSEETNIAHYQLPDSDTEIHAPTFVRMGSIVLPKWTCCTPKALDRKYAHYSAVYRAQSRFADQGGDFRVLSSAMGFLPSVTDIVIGGDSWSPDRAEKAEILLGDAWCDDCVDEQADFDAHLMQLILRSLAASGLKVRRFRIDEWDLDFDLAQLSAMVPRAVYTAVFERLVVLGLNSVYYRPGDIAKYQQWRGGDCDTNYDYGDRYESLALIEHPCSKTMRILDHQMMDDGDEPQDLASTVDGLTKALAAMLSSCPLVEDLTLSSSITHRPSQSGTHLPHLPLLKMLGHNQLSKLQKLKLAHFRLEEDQLVGTLLLCAPTLQHLHINDIVLDRGTWESAFDRLRGRLHLASAEIGHAGGVWGMGPEMRASIKSHGIRKLWFAFAGSQGYEPYELCICDREARDWLGGRTLMINPVWQFMRECAAKGADGEDYSDGDEADGSDEPSGSDTED